MFRHLIVIACMFIAPVWVTAQNAISGIINQYYEVSVVSSNSVTLTSVTGLNAGDTVMLYQSKGAMINTTQTASFGSITAINEAGNWELLIVQSVNTSSRLVTFNCPISKTYFPPFQLIRVPSYYNARITSVLTCQQHNGITGGVLCMIVRNQLEMNAGIDVSGKGNTGAVPDYSLVSNCASTGLGFQRYSYTALSDSAGFKGGGIVGDPMGMIACGRGKIANGGGGGNGLNSAGAGGGNGGAGGKGGGESDWCMSPLDAGGIGGLSLQTYYNSGKLFMGGSGGAGLTEIAASDPLAGGNGGGIAIIIAGTIIANGNTINAQGTSVTGTTYEESAGGGGAGGTILVHAGSVSGILNASVSGGQGGSTGAGSNATCRGSGGGGAGGMILYNSAASAMVKNLNGGNPGALPGMCSAWQGGAGGQGGELNISTLPLTCIVFSSTIANTIQASQNICSGKIPATLTGPVPTGGTGSISGYLWEQSTNGGTSWTACPIPNTNQNYSFSAGLTQTTQYRRLVVFSGGETAYSNVVTITVWPNPTATASDDGPYCAGETISLFSGPAGMDNYQWSGPGGFASNIQNPIRPTSTTAMSGTYTVTVTDSNTCTGTASVIVSVNPLHTANATNTGPYCAGQTIQFNLTTSGSSYEWSGPGGWTSTAKNPTRTNSTTLMSGTYFVTVSGTGGCPVFTSTQVTVNPTPNPTATNTGPYCTGETIVLNAGPSSLPQYQWAGPGGFTASGQSVTRPAATSAMAGTYTVTVTNGYSCSATNTTNVIIHPGLTASPLQVVQIDCHGNQNGLAEMQASGGTPPFTYLWSNSATTNPITNLAAGTYTCTITDANSCTGSWSVMIVEPFAVQPFIAGSLTVHPTCFGSSDGEIAAGANGGTGPGTYTFSWDNGSSDSLQTGLPQGYYYVTVTDANGCTGETAGMLVWPAQIIVSPDTIASPVTVNDGYIEITVSNGFPPLSYLWSNGAITEDIYFLTAGTYTVTVTDDHLCTSVASYTLVTANLDLVLTGDSLICEGDSGLLFPSSSFPIIAGVSYLWNTGDTTEILTIHPAFSQYFSLTITDPISIQYTDSIWVEVVPYPVFHITGDSVICEGEATTLTPSATSNSYTYEWSSGDTGQNLNTAPVNTQMYWLTITDNGCSYSDSIEIAVSPAFTVDITGDTAICLYDTATFRAVTSNPAITDYTYLWNPYSTADSLYYWAWTGTGNQTVSVTVTAGACTVVQQHNVLVKALPNISISGPNQVCFGETTLLTCSGSGVYYYWSESTLGNSITINPTVTSTYWAATIGPNGCVNIASHTITVNPVSEIYFLNNDSICLGEEATITASITGTAAWDLVVSNGSETFSYQDIATSPFYLTLSPLQSGMYTVTTFLDGNGCPGQHNTSFTVTVNPPPVAFAGNDTAVCSNACGLKAILGNGETGLWSSLQPTLAFVNPNLPNTTAAVGVTNNTYTLIWTVTGTTGCTDSDTVLITFNSQPAQPNAGEDMQVLHANQIQLNATPPLFGFGHWNLVDGFGLITDTLLYNTTITNLSQGDNIFRWTVENPPCPSKYDEVTITVLSVTIPTGFSPNYDGTNDYFVITGLELYPENTLEVFNRWGIIVYSSDPYNNNWDGRDFNEQILPDDTYFFVLHLNENEFTKGYVVIHR